VVTSVHGSPRFGDVFIFDANEHAAVYLFDGLIFQKPSAAEYHVYEVVRQEHVFRTIRHTMRYFAKGSPAGSWERQPADIFNSWLHAATAPSESMPQARIWRVATSRAQACGRALKL
jgi:hypothetical protein